MMDTVVTEVLRQGFSGAVIVALAFAYYQQMQVNKALQDRFEALQNQRVADAKAVQVQLLENNTHCVTALTAANVAIDASRETMNELRDAFKDLSDDVKDLHRGARS